MPRKVSARQLGFSFHFRVPDIEERLSEKMGEKVKITYTDNTNTMISTGRAARGVVALRLHHMFEGADREIIGALAKYLKRQDRYSSELLNEFINENDHLIRRRTRPHRPAIKTGGMCHDLAAYYDRLNQRYFKGRLDAGITWGRKSNKRHRYNIRLGSYCFDQRLIRIHPALDKRWVPRYYVESVIYHEMLHVELNLHTEDGVSTFHNRAFKERERQFAHFDRAIDWEKRHITRLIYGRT